MLFVQKLKHMKFYEMFFFGGGTFNGTHEEVCLKMENV